MTLRLVTPPAFEPITRDNTKIKLGISATDTSSDLQIDWMIPAARRWVEQRINKALVTQTWALYLDGFPEVISVPMGNVQSITHIKYTGPDGVVATMNAADYQLDLFSMPARIAPVYNVASWPAARRYAFNVVEIQFVAGYGAAADIPADIIEALYRVVGHWLNNQSAIEHGTSITRIPFAVEQMLWPYLDYNYGLNDARAPNYP